MCRHRNGQAVAHAAEKLFSMSDDEYSTLEERAQNTINEMMLLSNTGIELAKYRRRNPGDDLMTSIVNAEVDGHRLTDEEDRRLLDTAVVRGQRHHEADHVPRDDGVGEQLHPTRLARSKTSTVESVRPSKSSCDGRRR